MAAAYLYRACLALTDMGYGKYRLHYVRTLDKRELDFVITVDNHPIAAIEVKTGETAVAKTLRNRENGFRNLPPWEFNSSIKGEFWKNIRITSGW